MITIRDVSLDNVRQLLQRYSLQLVIVADDSNIPGSFWGDSEAGLIDTQLYVQNATPLHSLLHEACHYVCMDSSRRNNLHTNAGGDYDEENAVCYLQILLADFVHPLNKSGLMADMNEWGYSFRLGSAEKWFAKDAEDARMWLIKHELINEITNEPTWKLR